MVPTPWACNKIMHAKYLAPRMPQPVLDSANKQIRQKGHSMGREMPRSPEDKAGCMQAMANTILSNSERSC
jgi:hypothetical protein